MGVADQILDALRGCARPRRAPAPAGRRRSASCERLRVAPGALGLAGVRGAPAPVGALALAALARRRLARRRRPRRAGVLGAATSARRAEAPGALLARGRRARCGCPDSPRAAFPRAAARRARAPRASARASRGSGAICCGVRARPNRSVMSGSSCGPASRTSSHSDRRLALDARVGVGEVVGGQALAVARGLPARASRGRRAAGSSSSRSTSSASVRPANIASRMPCPVTGSLKCPASPASAQPGPEEARKKAGVSPVERSFDPGGAPATRAARPGCSRELALPVALGVAARLAGLVAVAHQQDQQPARPGWWGRRTRTSRPRATGSTSRPRRCPRAGRPCSGTRARGRCARCDTGATRRPARRPSSGARRRRRRASQATSCASPSASR